MAGDPGTVGSDPSSSLVSTRPQPRPQHNPWRVTNSGPDLRPCPASTHSPVLHARLASVPRLASNPNSASPQPSPSRTRLGPHLEFASDSVPSLPSLQPWPHHGSRLGLASAPASPQPYHGAWPHLGPLRLAALAAVGRDSCSPGLPQPRRPPHPRRPRR